MQNVTFEGNAVKVDGETVGTMERNDDGTWSPDGELEIRLNVFRLDTVRWATRLEAEEAVCYAQALIDAGLMA